MRNYIELLEAYVATHDDLTEAAEIPDTEYGYWIDPEGKFYAVPFQSHNAVIDSISNGKLNKKSAVTDGWVRIATVGKGYLIVRLQTDRATVRAVSALRQLATSGRYRAFELETQYGYKHFDNPAAMIATIKSERTSERQDGKAKADDFLNSVGY